MTERDERRPDYIFGRPKLQAGTAKSENYVFRVSRNERKLLDAIGSPSQWRDYCTMVAGLIAAKKEGKSYNYTFEDLFKMAFIKGVSDELDPDDR